MSVFTWEVWWGKMLTMDQLKKRGFQLAGRCLLCQDVEGSLDHLLIHCPVVWGLYATLISLLRMVWACPFLAKDIILELATFSIRKKARKIWKATPPNLFWAIWKERNRIIFENKGFSSSRLKQSFNNSLSNWAGLIYAGDCSIVRILLCIL